MKLNLVPKEFKKKVSVADIKQYLVDEFQKSNTQQNEIEKLKDQLKKALELEIKYNATLITLDEYKQRLEDRERRVAKLDSDIEKLENKVRKENELKNDEILKYKKLNEEYSKIKKNFDKEVESKVNSIKQGIIKEYHLKTKNFINEKIKLINETKGNLSKSKFIELLKK